MNMAALGVQVLAFEPMEENIVLINKSLQLPQNIESGLSNRVKLYPHALGPKNAACFIFSEESNHGNGHVSCVKNDNYFSEVGGFGVRGKSQIRRLDDVVSTDGLAVVAIKMDTEGFESDVIEGGSSVLLNGGAEVIITEYQPLLMKEKGFDPVGFIKKLADAAYRIQMPEDPNHHMSQEEMIQKAETGKLEWDLILNSQKYILESGLNAT